jgi:hypothetical protein
LIAIRGTQFSGHILAVLAPKAGRHLTKVMAIRSAPEFSDYLLDIAAHSSDHLAQTEFDYLRLAMESFGGPCWSK